MKGARPEFLEDAPVSPDVEKVPDPLLDCLQIVAAHHGCAVARDALRAGLPITDERITPSLFVRAAQLYHDRFAGADGRIPATFDVLYLTGWAPHASQPQPLAPGSARHRLADSLGTVESPAGDKARPR